VERNVSSLGFIDTVIAVPAVKTAYQYRLIQKLNTDTLKRQNKLPKKFNTTRTGLESTRDDRNISP